MAAYFLVFVLLLASPKSVQGLQVTPNSGCASTCADYYGANPSDPDASNTVPSDVICKDSDYSTTVAGFKYRSCIDCLQTSNAEASRESDQTWFLYNIRYTLQKCLSMAANTTTRIDSPCSASSMCGPLTTDLQVDMQSPSQYNQFSYCSANDGRIGTPSSSLATCQQCLQQSTNAYYLSNFLVALEAGCTQRPTNGNLIGLKGSLFSRNRIQVTDPTIAQTTSLPSATPAGATTIIISYPVASFAAISNPQTKVLTSGSISGIAVGGLVAVIIVISCCVIGTKKYRNAKKLESLRSPLHSRFGAANISAPIQRAYSSPDLSPPMGGMYKSSELFPQINVTPVQVSSAPTIRNFSLRNFGLIKHNQEQRTRGRIDTRRIWRTPDSFSPGPSLLSPQSPQVAYHDRMPAHYAYTPPVPLYPISETPSTYDHQPQPLTSNPVLPPTSVAIPSRARLSRFSIPHLSTMIPSPLRVANPWTSSATHEHPPDSQISAPIMTNERRFESEIDVIEARDMFRAGASGGSIRRKWPADVKSPEKSSPDSASTAISLEMWPGSF